MLCVLTAGYIEHKAFAQDMASEGMGMDGMGMDGMSIMEDEFSSDQIEFFESKVRPLLISNCGGCHSETSGRLRGGLSLDSRERMISGGDSGAVIVPGDPDASLLIIAVRYHEPEYEMPPRGPLTTSEVRILEDWVRMGAPFPGSGSNAGKDLPPGTEHRWSDQDIEDGRNHWAYRSLSAPEIPQLAHDQWSRNDIDRILYEGMLSVGTHPVPDADPSTWLRRVSFDLTGLPPTPQEAIAFAANHSPEDVAATVERLLESDGFGERWGRHWLDVARYAESSGKETNVLYPHSWRYRDYVIDSFNIDKPFDRFIREQIAGDLLPAFDEEDRAENLVATGLLAIGVKGHNTRGKGQFTADLVDEQINTVTQAFLGTTVACARCHDHKFDPIPQRDYYAMAGIFASTETRFGTFQSQGNNHPSSLIALPVTEGVSSGGTLNPQIRSLIAAANRNATQQSENLEKIRKQFQEARRSGKPTDPSLQRSFQQARNAAGQVNITNSILERFEPDGESTDANQVCAGAVEGKIQNAPFLERGEITRAGKQVPRGFVQVISGEWSPTIRKGSGRMELADWIASPRNPLTARVWANRIWLHLFGYGIVSTPDNFGLSGKTPSNPVLLDHLAQQLIRNQWSTKSLIRDIVLSRAYAMSSKWDKSNAEVDPEVASMWRMPKRRLEAEAIRDSILMVAGVLDNTRPNGSPVGKLEGLIRGRQLLRALEQTTTAVKNNRSVYLPVVRGNLPDELEVFDFPDPTFSVGKRDRTNVATQALYLMNDETILQLADQFAQRVLSENERTEERIRNAFMLAFSRFPSSNEFLACRKFLRDFPKAVATDARTSGRTSASNQSRSRERSRTRGRSRNRTENSKPQLSSEMLAWSGLCQTLIQSAEFRTRE